MILRKGARQEPMKNFTRDIYAELILNTLVNVIYQIIFYPSQSFDE
jgi:hypothetical protein